MDTLHNNIVITEQFIQIYDRDIIQFFYKNTHIDLQTCIHFIMELIQNITSNFDTNVNSNNIQKLYSLIENKYNEQRHSIQILDTSLKNMDKNISTMQTDDFTRLHDKLMQNNTEVIDKLSLILQNNILNLEKQYVNIQLNNSSNFEKNIKHIFQDILPISQDKNFTLIENCIKTHSSNIQKDIQLCLSNNINQIQNIQNIHSIIDNNFTKLIHNINKPITDIIDTYYSKTFNDLQYLKQEFYNLKNTQENTSKLITEFFNKYKYNSCVKGNISENQLYYIIQSILPHDELIRVSSSTATCDIRLNRKNINKPSILFENKDYHSSVTTDEVHKFERDLQIQQLHGIFISHNSPITFKEEFQIDINNNIIHVYLPNANYDVYKIKTAIDIIDQLSEKIKHIQQFNTNNSQQLFINTQDLEELTHEYQTFVTQKNNIQQNIKTMFKQLNENIDNIQFPKIKNLLNKMGKQIQEETFLCPYKECNFKGKSKTSLNSHLRFCKCKNKDIVEFIPS